MGYSVGPADQGQRGGEEKGGGQEKENCKGREVD